MKTGMIFYLFIVAFLVAIGTMFTWYALAGDWVNTSMPSDFQALTRWEFVMALWLGMGVVLIGGYQGAKDSGWELPTYETSDSAGEGAQAKRTLYNATATNRLQAADALTLQPWPDEEVRRE